MQGHESQKYKSFTEKIAVKLIAVIKKPAVAGFFITVKRVSYFTFFRYCPYPLFAYFSATTIS